MSFTHYKPFRLFLCLAVFLIGLTSKPALSDARKLTIVALGDSLTAGYALGATEGFAPQLQQALADKGRSSVQIINAGVSGDTTAGGLARLDWATADNPDAVILELGANDALRGIDPEVARNNLDMIITRLKARNIPVLLAGMKAPPNLGADYTKAFDAIYPDLAEKHDLILYPFFLDGVAAEKSRTLPDGMHPNADGVKVMVERILPSVEELIDSISHTSNAQ